MLTHEQIWAAIDALAAQYGLSPSGLARRAGLDPTSFNRSKRIGPEGRERWPSTESVAKILRATGAGLDEFIGLIDPALTRPKHSRLPIVPLEELGQDELFDHKGMPLEEDWERIPVPDLDEEETFAVAVAGDALLPLYRDGDVLVVSPSARLRRGDRAVLRTVDGAILGGQITRATARDVDVMSFNPRRRGWTFRRRQIAWIGRVLWARQ